MLQPVAVGHKTLADYTHIVGQPLVEEIRELAAPLEGKRILHVSATAFGGGVSEILYTLIPLMRDVGLDVRVARHLRPRGVLQRDQAHAQRAPGQPAGPLARASGRSWERYNEMNARELSEGWDVCIVHDPQPAAVHSLVPEKAGAWVWRCHIDLSDAQPGDDRAPAALHQRLSRPRSSTSRTTSRRG